MRTLICVLDSYNKFTPSPLKNNPGFGKSAGRNSSRGMVPVFAERRRKLASPGFQSLTAKPAGTAFVPMQVLNPTNASTGNNFLRVLG
jgi:hypothetical protein